jgi:hypothetical protein
MGAEVMAELAALRAENAELSRRVEAALLAIALTKRDDQESSISSNDRA